MLAQLARLAREKPVLLAAWVSVLVRHSAFNSSDARFSAMPSPMSDSTSGPGSLLGRDFVNVFTAGHLVVWMAGWTSSSRSTPTREYQAQMFEGRVLARGLLPCPAGLVLLRPAVRPRRVTACPISCDRPHRNRLPCLPRAPMLHTVGCLAQVALLIPAALVNVSAGHSGFVFGALWLAAWHLASWRTRPRTAGVFGSAFHRSSSPISRC